MKIPCGESVGKSDSGKRVIRVVRMPPTVPFMITISLFTLPPGVCGPNVDVDEEEVGGWFGPLSVPSVKKG